MCIILPQPFCPPLKAKLWTRTFFTSCCKAAASHRMAPKMTKTWSPMVRHRTLRSSTWEEISTNFEKRNRIFSIEEKKLFLNFVTRICIVFAPLFSDESVRESPPLPVIAAEINMSDRELHLATVPGEDVFNPRARRFEHEELRPLPVMRKAKKVRSAKVVVVYMG